MYVRRMHFLIISQKNSWHYCILKEVVGINYDAYFNSDASIHIAAGIKCP